MRLSEQRIPQVRPRWKRLEPAVWLLVAPLLLFLLLTLGFPLLANLFYSLTDLSFRNLRSPDLTGFGNFASALRDPVFWGGLGFSLRFALAATFFEVLLGLLMALAFQPILERHRPLLALLLLPMMVAPALLGTMYRLILNDFIGVVPDLAQRLGLFVNFLTPPLVVPTLVAIEVLQWTPFALLILYTALQAIPGELHEAAKVDGANSWQQLRFVTLPLLVPALAITALIRFIDSFRVFDHIMVLTGGGPGTSTTSISIYIYLQFFRNDELGTAIAASLFLLLLALVPLFISMRVALREWGRA
ncbi:ABC transporter permease [Meiothermus granaticius NBRC 107808]|uniref:Trehalose transport system permease protein SugA n=1 Tax=Meiothermus granaticius NBRC 107808 TaxID=1227551 RepID=A0A399FAE3_9DEIN|nr:Trehalose transport system permease protein SugA [Meiothermus granaticius NBRC 107808]GEM86605.1 ABC transporter permease [Meiothermus granaticius NBRC 107808]